MSGVTHRVIIHKKKKKKSTDVHFPFLSLTRQTNDSRDRSHNITQEITSEVWMLAGTADKPKEICVNHHVANLGRKKSEAVLGLHAFTGGDWGGKFSGVTKERWTQRFLELDEGSDVITAL